MGFFQLFSILLVLTSIIGLINYKFIKLPSAIGIMLISLILSFVVVILGQFYPMFFKAACDAVDGIQFSGFLLETILSFMLFSGAFNLDSSSLKKELFPIILFATIGVLLSTAIVAVLMYFVLQQLGIGIEFIYCLLFGSLISPTDPIAVLSILKRIKIPQNLESDIEGESLLNDGVAVVLFITLFQIAQSGSSDIVAMDIAWLFLKEAVGGALLGGVVGYIGFRVLKNVNVVNLDVMITLAIVMGSYTLANYIEVSGPITVVVAGLVLSSYLVRMGLTTKTKEYVQNFWDIIDEVLNSILFFLIGLEVIGISHSFEYSFLWAGIIAVGVVLFSRLISMIMSMPFSKSRKQSPGTAIAILTWGGLRGGISVALALSVTDNMHSALIVSITYIVVLFSIVVQGLTIGPLVKKLSKKE